MSAHCFPAVSPVPSSPLTLAFGYTPERGEHVQTPGGVPGVYVGERLGLDVVCYEPATFAEMCAAFDGCAS